MLEQQQHNLTELITSSHLLNSSEKEEWLVLLDLMDDKQAFELEKILRSSQTPVKPVVVPPAPKQEPTITPAAMPAMPPKQPSKPPLSHIVNFPQKSDKAPHKPAPVFNKFKDDLDRILDEKDLPAGEMSKQIPSRLEQDVKEEHITIAPGLPKIERKVSPISPSISEPVETEPIPEIKHQAEPTIRPGLENSSNLMQAARYQEQLQTEQATAKIPAIEAQTTPVTTDDRSFTLKLETLESVAELTIANWRSQNHPELLNQLRKLIINYGYHATIFKLEKSPLYNSYIESGLESLKQGHGLAKLDEQHMNKQEFEEFTDLLREIQVN